MSKKDKRKIVQMILHQNLEKQDKEDIIDLLADTSIAVDVDKEEERNLTLAEKMADKISEIAGSWTFIFISIIFLLGWMVINTFIMQDKEIDPYPYILLNLILSCISALQAPIIMMSQNRASKKDSLRNQNDYKIDLKSELLLEDLHHKVEILINNQNRLLRDGLNFLYSHEKNITFLNLVSNYLVKGSYLLAPNFLNNNIECASYICSVYEYVNELLGQNKSNLLNLETYQYFLEKSNIELIENYHLILGKLW